MKKSVWQDLKQDWKQNNDGASLVTVLVLVALLVIIVGVILTMTLMNYFMKEQNAQAQQNFYDAESALEEVRQGLILDLSDAAGMAYTKTLEQYENLSQTEKQKYFQKICYEKLCQTLETSDSPKAGKHYYDLAHLESFFTNTKAETLSDGSVVGASIETATADDAGTGQRQENRLNEEADGIVLKNVKVSYVDRKHNKTTISTDIFLAYPNIDFSNADTLENIVFYSLIAQKNYKQLGAGETRLTGNAFLGNESAEIRNGSLVAASEDQSILRLIAGGDLSVDNAGLSCQQTELWAQNVTLSRGADWQVTSGNSYLQNDLVLNDNASANMSGSLFAYGDPPALAEAASLSKDKVNASPADYSSSIIINGKNARLDLGGLQALYLAGVSYINTKGAAFSVATGQSVMTKGDQKAYLIPGEVIGAGYQNGGANPMTAKQWEDLCKEIAFAKGYEDASQVTEADVLSYDKTIPGIGESLQTLGAQNGYDRVAMQVNGLGTLYYFFMKFDSQEDRNAFTRKYYQKAANYHALADNISYYVGNQIVMPEDLSDTHYFYFQGNALVTGSENFLIPDSLQEQAQSTEATQNRQEKERQFADRFAALKIHLSKDYARLTDTQKERSLFQNLVATDQISRDHAFVTTDGIGAVVVAGDYSISDKNDKNSLSHVKDSQGIQHADAKVQLVIATGDVTVKRDFSGLVICGGTLTVESGCDLKRDIGAVTSLLQAKDADGDGVSRYLRDTNRYLLGESTDASDSENSLSDCVYYRQWKKVSE